MLLVVLLVAVASAKPSNVGSAVDTVFVVASETINAAANAAIGGATANIASSIHGGPHVSPDVDFSGVALLWEPLLLALLLVLFLSNTFKTLQATQNNILFLIQYYLLPCLQHKKIQSHSDSKNTKLALTRYLLGSVVTF